jgi:hypothetical protein
MTVIEGQNGVTFEMVEELINKLNLDIFGQFAQEDVVEGINETYILRKF